MPSESNGAASVRRQASSTAGIPTARVTAATWPERATTMSWRPGSSWGRTSVRSRATAPEARVATARAVAGPAAWVARAAPGPCEAMGKSSLSRLMRASLAGLVGLSLLALTSSARANPRPLPFTYQSESLAKGTGEVEQFIDFIPTQVTNANSGAPTHYLATQFQTEIEYGLTDRLEIALYLMFVPQPNPSVFTGVPQLTMGNGASQRIRYRFADPGAWPVDVAVYGEVTETDRELYYTGAREWGLNPTLGATYEFSPKFHLGIEGWMRAEYLDNQVGEREFDQGPHVFVGPAFMFNFGPVWWTTGAYARVTDPHHDNQAGDAFGRVWVRTVVGLGFCRASAPGPAEQQHQPAR